jgi:hypothetical protein
MRMRGEALDRKSIPKAPFIFYLFVYEHIIMLKKLNQVGLPSVYGTHLAFGGTLDRQCPFKHVSLKQSSMYHCQKITAHR